VLGNTFLVFTIAIGMGGTCIVVVVSEVLADLGLSIADWGILWSAISLGVLFFAIIGGALGDRFGIRLIAGLGIVFMGIFLTLRGTATSFGTMFVWMFLFGVALGFVFPNIPKALGMWFPPQEFGMANGITLAGNGVGAGMAALFTPLLLEFLGDWRKNNTPREIADQRIPQSAMLRPRSARTSETTITIYVPPMPIAMVNTRKVLTSTHHLYLSLSATIFTSLPVSGQFVKQRSDLFQIRALWRRTMSMALRKHSSAFGYGRRTSGTNCLFSQRAKSMFYVYGEGALFSLIRAICSI